MSDDFKDFNKFMRDTKGQTSNYTPTIVWTAEDMKRRDTQIAYNSYLNSHRSYGWGKLTDFAKIGGNKKRDCKVATSRYRSVWFLSSL